MSVMSLEEINLELLSLIWLDKFADATQENREIQEKLREIINSVRIFDNCQSCQDFLQDETNDQYEKMILIVSGQFGEDMIENIHSLRKIISIFVFCGNKEKHQLWAKNYPKIRNVVVTVEDLFKQIQIDKKSAEQKLNQSIEIVTDDNQIIEFLLEIPPNIEDRREFLNICLKYYQNNKKELENIEEFEHLYLSSNALNSFLDETFLYRLLIKSLLTRNILMLFLLRFYLQDINEQLKHCQQFSLKLYFGQLMTIDQIENFNHFNKETIFRFNSFIIVNENEEQILNSLQNSFNTNGLHKVLFEIDQNEIAKIFKNRIFFPINTNFNLISIRFEKRIWFVKLNVSHLNHFNSNSKMNPIEFAHYCRNLGLFDQSEKLFSLFLNEYSQLNSQSYDGLGRIAQEKCLYEISLQFYYKSLERVSFNDRCHCLNNIGCIYDYLEEYDKALEYYFQSLKLMKTDQQKSMCLENIGITFGKRKEYEKAMEYFQNSLKKRKKIFSNNHYQIGISYSNIGRIYLSIQQFDKALEYFHLALKYFQVNQTNFFKAIVYLNIAQLFQETLSYDKAIQFYQDSLHIFTLLKPINHPNILFIQQQIQLLKQLK